jgi:hypothetical protein
MRHIYLWVEAYCISLAVHADSINNKGSKREQRKTWQVTNSEFRTVGSSPPHLLPTDMAVYKHGVLGSDEFSPAARRLADFVKYLGDQDLTLTRRGRRPSP